MGIGFTVMLLVMGAIREVLGSGTFLGARVMPAAFEPWVIMVLPPGGFLTLGCVMLTLAWWRQRKETAAAIATVAGGAA
jgi:electron transport complex protein RnfE